MEKLKHDQILKDEREAKAEEEAKKKGTRKTTSDVNDAHKV